MKLQLKVQKLKRRLQLKLELNTQTSELNCRQSGA